MLLEHRNSEARCARNHSKKMHRHADQLTETMKQFMNRMTALKALALSVLLLALTSAAIANDSTVRIGVGGLVFLKNDDIRMVSEVLSVSPNRINVRYRFRNETATAIDAVVAFPMPAFRWNPGVAADDANIGPIETFTVRADGRAVAMKVEQKALLGKRDITANLRDAGLTDKQIFRSFGDMMDWRPRLAAEQSKNLDQLGAMNKDGPQWEVAETAYWQQRFPGNSELPVEHSYTPLRGMSYGYYTADDDFAVKNPLPPQDRFEPVCLDEGSRSAVIKRISALAKPGATQVKVMLDEVEYILGTGRNWKGPISDFTLDIVKATPDQIVSLCFPGKATRVDDLTLRFQHKNFVPPDRLLVYFYSFKIDK